MPTRPIRFPHWATDALFPAGGDPWSGMANKVEPSAGQKGTGFVPQVKLPAEHMNDLLKLLDDWQLYLDSVATPLKQTLIVRPPVTPGTEQVQLRGYSAITQVGTGTGTVLPSQPSSTYQAKTYGTEDVVVKIIVGGVVGVATFQWSNDAGETYGATTPTAALYTDGPSGIRVAFSGTFDAGTTYAFRPADAPQVRLLDQFGFGRMVIGHSGFPFMGSEFREEWFDGAFVFTGTNFASLIASGKPQWQVAQTGAGTDTRGPEALSASIDAPRASISAGTGNGNVAALATLNPLFRQPMPNGFSAVFRWEFFMSAIGANNVTWRHGFNNTPNTALAASLTSNYLLFSKASADTNWQVLGNGLTGATTQDTGVAVINTGYQRFRVEFLRSAAGAGLRLRAFIDELLVFDREAGAVGSLQHFVAASINTAAATESIGKLGRIHGTWAPQGSVQAM